MLTGANLTPAPIDLRRIQNKRKIVLRIVIVIALVLLLFTGSYWRSHARLLYDAIEGLGVLMIIACIFGRTWSTLYIGGRKRRELVTIGPYSLVRNPLYFSTLVGAFGIGAQSGSLVVAVLAALIVFAVFHDVVTHEEKFLREAFPNEFAAYENRVPKFLPRLNGWRDTDKLEISTRLVWCTFLETCLFLLSVPAAKLVDELHYFGWIPVYLHLP